MKIIFNKKLKYFSTKIYLNQLIINFLFKNK
jgi:hypothetical protein